MSAKDPRIHVRYNHWFFRFPFMRRYRGICVGRNIWFRESEEKISQELLRHEMAHQAQISRHGMAGFYCRYLVDYVGNLARYRNHWRAYQNITFEVEARRAEESPDKKA